MNKKERIAEIISNSLKSGFEVFEVVNTQYMNSSKPLETEFTATIKSKYDSVFIGYVRMDFKNGFKSIANMLFCKNILTNFSEIFIDGEDVINKMKQYVNELSLMYAYCFAESIKRYDFSDINKILYKYDTDNYTLKVDIQESSIMLSSKLDLKIDKLFLGVMVMTNKGSIVGIICSIHDIIEQEKFKRLFLEEWAAKPLNKELEELKLEDYKLLHMINY